LIVAPGHVTSRPVLRRFGVRREFVAQAHAESRRN
jgi:hypothetical protein